MSIDRFVRNIQNFTGPKITGLAQRILGVKGTRYVRYLIGRAVPHHVEVNVQKETIGIGNDAWVICPDYLFPHSIVYSLGVGNEIQFDLLLIKKYNVEVYAFDPTPKSIAWIHKQKLPDKFHFIDYGVMDYDGTAQFEHLDGMQFGPQTSFLQNREIVELKVFRLVTIMKNLNHTKIDLLKINIEGGEYAVISDLVASDLDVTQVVVEFHHRLPGYSLEQTKQAVHTLNTHGYKIFHIAENGKEYSFIKLLNNAQG